MPGTGKGNGTRKRAYKNVDEANPRRATGGRPETRSHGFTSHNSIGNARFARNKCAPFTPMSGHHHRGWSCIATASVGQRAQQQAQQQIAAMGSNMLFVLSSGTVSRGGMRMGWGATKTLIYDDMLAILRECPSAK